MLEVIEKRKKIRLKMSEVHSEKATVKVLDCEIALADLYEKVIFGI
jgi:hypothetical protein